MKMSLIVGFLWFAIFGQLAEAVTCKFDPQTLTFAGSPTQQGRCLLQPVKIYGHLSKNLGALPESLAMLGKKVKLKKPGFRAYLRKKGITELSIGGSLDEPIARNSKGKYARYFVIHDTSFPFYASKRGIPNSIDSAKWSWNQLEKKWSNNKVAHVFINRLGDSISTLNFRKAWRATKLEMGIKKRLARGLFLHVELIQPRGRDFRNGRKNDAIAPKPGFTDAQLERLALVYIAASIRRGVWLVPAFHSVLDSTFPNAHDDPQNFDLHKWVAKIEMIKKKLLQPIDPSITNARY